LQLFILLKGANLVKRANKKPLKSTTPVTQPPLFQTTDDAPVMTSHPYLSGAQACLGTTLWDDIEGVPCFRRFFGQGFIEHNIIKENPETNRLELIAGNAAWEIIQKFNPEVAYMFLVFASCATDLERPWSGAFTIKGTDLIKTFGWSKNSHPNQPKNTSVEDSQKLISGGVLSSALKLKGWTKSHLAERLGLQKSLPGKWINGSRKIQPVHLKLLWELLATELNQVLSE
jgi:predicted peroxiredoxin